MPTPRFTPRDPASGLSRRFLLGLTSICLPLQDKTQEIVECYIMAYFNVSEIKNPSKEYVCWIDIMGTKEAMKTDVRRCANFIFKLHALVLQACVSPKDIILYPVMDGVYITSPSKKLITDCICNIFSCCSADFCNEKEEKYLYLIKGALAYGPIYHGKDIPSACNRVFDNRVEYKQSLLLGMPIIQAFLGEKEAPPFGIYIDESARTFAPENETPFPYKWYRWDMHEKISSKEFIDKMARYFNYAHKHMIQLDYHLEDLKRHISMFNDYFEENIRLEDGGVQLG